MPGPDRHARAAQDRARLGPGRGEGHRQHDPGRTDAQARGARRRRRRGRLLRLRRHRVHNRPAAVRQRRPDDVMTAAAGPAAVAWARPGEGVLRVTLQWPPANALGVPLIEGLNRALDDASGEQDIKIIVVVSDVPGFFAAGADIKHMAAADAEAFAAYGHALRETLGRLADPGWISIAAVEGLALGGGLELALACTLRVAGAQARLGLPGVKRSGERRVGKESRC